MSLNPTDPISSRAAAGASGSSPAPASQRSLAGTMQSHRVRVVILEESRGSDPIVTREAITTLRKQATSIHEARHQLDSLGKQKQEGERTLRAIRMTKQLIEEYRQAGHSPKFNDVPADIRDDVKKLYSYAKSKLGTDPDAVNREFAALSDIQHDYVASLRGELQEIRAGSERIGQGPEPKHKARKSLKPDAQATRESLQAARESEPKGAASAAAAAAMPDLGDFDADILLAALGSNSEPEKTASAAAAAASSAPVAAPVKPPAMNRETIAASAAFAREYLANPKNKFVGETGLLSQLKEGQMIKLSRRKVKVLTGQNIPHSVTIIKNSRAPGGYEMFFHQHSKDIVTGQKFQENKVLGDGATNKATRVAVQEGVDVAYRQPKDKNAVIAVKTADAIAEDKVHHAMRGRSEYIVMPLGTEVDARTASSLDLEETAFALEKGSISLRFAGDGAQFTGFNADTNTMGKMPSKAQALNMIDTLTHAFFDLHSNHIAQMDVKIENSGVFVDPSNPDNVVMKLHDFEKAANTANPTERRDPRNRKIKPWSETTKIASDGTPWTMSPEQAQGGTERQQIILDDLLTRKAAAKDDPEAQNAIDDQIRQFLDETYSKMDCYSMALMAHILMVGKMPGYLHAIFQVPAYSQPSLIADLNIQFSPDNGIGASLRGEFTAAARARGFDDTLINLVLRGLSTDPAQRPSAREFQQYFQALKTPPK